ncbi:MAG: AEC family transporter, partial [Clostridia bacterium]|nr:AEC family transporter [Clostridia bacterium]
FWAFLSLFPIDPLMIGVTTIMTAMPCATNSTILCHEYGGDAELSASGVFLSTIISVITIPALTYFLLR